VIHEGVIVEVDPSTGRGVVAYQVEHRGAWHRSQWKGTAEPAVGQHVTVAVDVLVVAVIPHERPLFAWANEVDAWRDSVDRMLEAHGGNRCDADPVESA
jgi:hypothetical protein